MEYPREITVLQAIAILISTMTGVGVLALPRIAVEAGGTGAPLVTLLGILLALAGLALIALLGMRFPEKSVILYSEDILGKWLGRIGSVLIIAFFITLTALTACEFGVVVKTSVLKDTPLDVLIIVMLLLAAVSTRQDRNTFTYIHLFYTPFIFLPGIFVFGFALANVQPINLQPLLGSLLWDPGGMFGGVLTVAALFQASFILTMVIPAMQRPKRAMTASLWGIGVTGVLYLIVVVMTLAVFGAEEMKTILWPTLELAKGAVIPVVERLDAAFLIGWVIVVFTTLYSTYFLIVQAISELFRLRDHRMLAPFVFPFIFFIAMLPQNTPQLYDVVQFAGRIGLGVTIVYPLLLLIVAIVRGKRGAPSHASRRVDKTD